jgi:hypothetical protein
VSYHLTLMRDPGKDPIMFALLAAFAARVAEKAGCDVDVVRVSINEDGRLELSAPETP